MRPVGTLALGLVLLAPAAKGEGPSYRVVRARTDRDTLLLGPAEAWTGSSVIAWGPAPYETRFRAVWDNAGLFLRFDADDDSPWHTLTRRDDHLWEEEVVEIFLDLDRSGRDYAELEISPWNVVCDVRMVSPSPNKKMDLSWNLQGLETRVRINRDAGGTIGWTATAFLPWTGFRSLPSSKGVSLPPNGLDAWRFNVFRIERPRGPKAPDKDVVEAAWSKPPGGSFHVPEVFRDFVFAAK